MEENNNNERTLLDKGKKWAKDTTEKAVKKGFKGLLPKLLPLLAGLLLILLAVGVINLIPYLISGKITSISLSATDGVSESIVSINEDGSYQLNSDNYSEQILEELDKQGLDNEAIGFNTEEFGDILDEYIKAEIRTTYPKTGLGESELDGIITIKRASVETGVVEDLTYKSYKDFCSMVNNNNAEVLKYFSLNPETLELCIARKSNSVTYYDYSGNQIVLTGSMGQKIVKEELDYQKYVQNYAVPFNFLVALHVISQDVDFMKDVLDLMVGEGKTEPIVLTYVDSNSVSTTTYEYSGTYSTNLTKLTAAEENKGLYAYEGSVKLDDLEELRATKTITNSNVGKYYSNISKYYQQVSVANSGKLYVTKADTWIQSAYKELTKQPTKEVINTNSEIVKNEKSDPRIIQIEELSDKMKKTTTTKVTETITIKTNTQRYTTTDEDSDIKVDEFVDLINSYPKVKNNITTAPSNLFYLLQQNENTQNIEKFMRYVMYKLNDIDYGIKEADLIYLLSDKEVYVSSSTLLKEYIRYWENGAGAPTNEDETCYIIEDDGFGHPTVGYGVDIENSGYKQLFIDNGYPTEVGGEVPIEFVDSIEDRIIDEKAAEIKAKTEGVELTEYQLNALISRAYNCGAYGATKVRNGKDFVQAYEAYWNPETDDLNEEEEPEADFTHLLYTQYMSEPVYSSGEYAPGLERRRKSEWTLFQTGYYDVLYRWHPGNESILKACVTVMNELLDANVHYSINQPGQSPLPGRIDIKTFDGYGCCCGTYVARVLYVSGVISADELHAGAFHSSGANCAGGIEAILVKAGWKKVDISEAQPGDVGIWHQINGNGTGHVFIYAGENEVWEQSSGVISTSGGSPTYGTNSNWKNYIDTHELCIYTMP